MPERWLTSSCVRRRRVVEVAADSMAVVVVVKEDLVGENVAKVEVEAEVPVSCLPEEPLE